MVDFTPRSTSSAFVFGRDAFFDPRVERFGDNLLRGFLQSGRQSLAPPMLRQFDLVAHKVTMTPSDRTQLIRVEWRPDERLRKGAIFQVVLLGPGARLVDVIRHDTSFTYTEKPTQRTNSSDPEKQKIVDGDGSFRRTIALRNVAEVIFLSASRDAEGGFSLSLSRPRQTPVLMATSWNCPSGRFLSFDPREVEWNWMSPDLEVVKDFTNMPHGTPREMIRLAVRNVGPRESVVISEPVSFWWKPWTKSERDEWQRCGAEDPMLSGLRSVDDHDRARRGDRMTQDSRMMGKQFVQVRAPTQAETHGQPYMIRAILPSSGDRRDQPLIVLGSSEPITSEAGWYGPATRGIRMQARMPDVSPASSNGCSKNGGTR